MKFFSPQSFRVQTILAVVLGVVTIFGFAPFCLFPIPIFSLAWLFLIWANASMRRAAWLGFLFGLGFFGAGVSWVYVSMHFYGGMNLPLAAFATILFCAFLALFISLVGIIQARVKLSDKLKFVLFIPALWVAAEWLRGWILTGFPWLGIGYSQVSFAPLSSLAPIFGVYGVSLLTVMYAGLIVFSVKSFQEKKKLTFIPVSIILVGILIGFGFSKIEWSQVVGEEVTVSLLQGNIDQDMKWREERLADSMQTYLDLAHTSNSRLIIFPETAIPLFSHQVPNEYLQNLARHAKSNRGNILIGLPEISRNKDQYFNSVFSIGTDPVQVYRKYHLVPFGEFLPFKSLLKWVLDILHIPLSDFSRGSEAPKPMRLGDQLVAINICYEDVFGEEIIRQLPQATLLVNVSNTAWFGKSIASAQHLQISQMRALETSRYMLRATNTGVTAIINERGEVLKQAPQFAKVAVHGVVQGRSGTTPYVMWGNGVILSILGSLLVLSVIIAKYHINKDVFSQGKTK